MKKQSEINLDGAKERSDAILADMKSLQESAELLMAECKEAVARLTRQYDAQITPLLDMINDDEKELLRLMKAAKRILFDGTDIVYLANGNLLYSKGDKVTIPRDALVKCEELGLTEAIKTVKSLDRDAVDKWSDEKLILIGAERKPVETFNYEIRKG